MRLPLAIALLALAACAGDPPVDDGPATPGCTAGETAACTCDDGADGEKTCDGAGAFGDCVCEAPAVPLTLICESSRPDPTGAADWLLELGRVAVGGRLEGSVTAGNVGDAPLTVTIEEAEAPFERITPATEEVAAGGQFGIRWAFTPTEAGEFHQVVALSFGDGAITVRVAAEAFAPTIDCDPEAIDLGRIVRGQWADAEVVCTNVATGPFPLVALVEGAIGDHLVARLEPTGAVEPAGEWTLTARFTSAATDTAGTFAGTIVLAGPGGLEATRIPVAAALIPTAVTVDPAALDFGTVDVGSRTVLPLAVKNLGSTPVTVSAIAFGGPSSPAYTVETSAPLTVPPAGVDGPGSASIEVAFNPGDARRHNGVLVLETDDPGASTVEVGVTGVAE